MYARMNDVLLFNKATGDTKPGKLTKWNFHCNALLTPTNPSIGSLGGARVDIRAV